MSKKVSRPLLPAEIIDRKKKGFPTPISMWLRGEARSFARDILSPSAIRRRGLFDPDYVRKLLNQHEAGSANHGSLIWALVNVELWHSLFIDAQPGAVSAGNRGIMPNSEQAGRREGRQ